MITETYINQKAHFERKNFDEVVMIRAMIGGIEVKQWFFRWTYPMLSKSDLYDRLTEEIKETA